MEYQLPLLACRVLDFFFVVRLVDAPFFFADPPDFPDVVVFAVANLAVAFALADRTPSASSSAVAAPGP